MVFQRNEGQEQDEILQNRFTSYLLAAVPRGLQNEIDLLLSKMKNANQTVLRYINEQIAELDKNKDAWERELGQLEDMRRSTTLKLDEIRLHEILGKVIKYR